MTVMDVSKDPHDVPEGDLPDDPAALLALIAAERERTRRRTAPSFALIGSAWGVAWLAGYLTLFLSADGPVPADWAFGVFSALLVVAVVITAVHTTRRAAGIRGDSATVGAMYGITWFVAFLAAGLLFAGAVRAGAGDAVMAVLTNGVSCIIVGLLYMAGGALWREWPMFGLGAWVALVAGAVALLGTPAAYLVMALAGGGGFLVAVLVDLARRRSA